MPHQHHPLTRHRQDVARFGLQHRLQVLEAIWKHLRARRTTSTLQPGSDSLGITAWMFQHHHGPTLGAEQAPQPAEVIGCPTQTWHQHNPGLSLVLLICRLPELQLQRLRAMGHLQRLDRGSAGFLGLERQGCRGRLQRNPIQTRHQSLLALQLGAPMGRHIEEAIEIKPHALRWQRFQEIETGDLGLLLQQGFEGVENGHSHRVVINPNQIRHLIEQASTGPAVEHLPGHAPIGDQRCSQQPQNPLATGGIQQIQPDPQLCVGDTT